MASLFMYEMLFPKESYPSVGSMELYPNINIVQHLMDTKSAMNSDTLVEFHQLMDLPLPTPNVPKMNLSTTVKNNIQNFEFSHNSLVGQVPKLLSPSFSILEGLHMQSSQPKSLTESDFSLNHCVSFLPEIFTPLDKFNIFEMKPLSADKMPDDPVNLSPAYDSCAKPAANVLQDSVAASLDDVSSLKSQKCVADSSRKLNQKLINRKEKKLNKRSKKRRRRQKKSNVEDSKEQHYVENSKKPMSQKDVVTSRPSRMPIPKTSSLNCDILCDIQSITGQANEDQVILPDLPSFVISVQSGDEDDSDWDACSDSDWLTDSSEFELSGLFVGNLTAPKISDSHKKGASHLDVPSISDDKEAHKLHNILLQVNKIWNETTKELESKPKLSPKVSFAPENELVLVLFVEEYDRKGEWETFALGRMRFKKRIDELESILSPCLSKEHREKVFHRMYETNS